MRAYTNFYRALGLFTTQTSPNKIIQPKTSYPNITLKGNQGIAFPAETLSLIHYLGQFTNPAIDYVIYEQLAASRLYPSL